MAVSPWVITINGPPCRYGALVPPDSMVVAARPEWWLDPDGEGPAFLAQVAGHQLRQLSEQSAHERGRELHHADWVITRDPQQVTTVARSGCRCDECEAALVSTLSWLEEHPREEVAAGLLYFAASAEEAGTLEVVQLPGQRRSP